MHKVKNWVDLGRGALDGGALPPVPTPFSGRWRELSAIKQKLQPGARVVLWADSGTRAGVGRTVLLRQVAGQTAESFPGGVFWWDLELDGRRPQLAFHRWGRQLKSPAPSIMSFETQTEVLRDVFALRASRFGPLLFAIDGVDEGAISSVLRVLDVVPEGSGVLLAVESHTVAEAFGGDQFEVEPLQVVEGLGLLRVAAGRSLPQNAAVAILKAVDHLPLGIRLVGSRYSVSPPADPAELVQLPDELSFDEKLVSRLPGNPAVAAVFYTLYAGLSPQARTAFRWIGALHGSRIHTRDVAGLAMMHVEEAARELEVLASTGLLEAGSEPNTWMLHPIMRSYARVLLRTEGEMAEARERHAAHFVTVVEENSGNSADDHVALLRVAADLNALIQYVVSSERGESAMTMADALVGQGAWVVGGYLEEAAAVLRAAVEGARATSDSRRKSYEKMMMELIRIAPRAVQAAGDVGEEEQRTHHMDSAEIEAARDECILAASEAALEAEGFVAQARVWIDGGRADAGSQESSVVRKLLERLDDIGAEVTRLADKAAATVGQVENAGGTTLMRKHLSEAIDARNTAESLAQEAEDVWARLQEALATEDAAQAHSDVMTDRIRQEVEVARRVLEDTRTRVQDQRSALPNGVTAAVRSTWAEVTRALGSATAAVEAAETALRSVRPNQPDSLTAAAEVARARREEVEQATQDALAAAMRAVRVAQATDGDSSVVEVRELAEKADAAARRFERVQRKIAGLLEPHTADPEASELLEQLHTLYQEVLDQVDAARSAVDGISHASSEGARRRFHRGAVTASREVSARALDALSLLPKAEGVAERAAHGVEVAITPNLLSAIIERDRTLKATIEGVRRRVEDLKSRARSDSSSDVDEALTELQRVHEWLGSAYETTRDALGQAERASSRSEAEEVLAKAARLEASVVSGVGEAESAISKVEKLLEVEPAPLTTLPDMDLSALGEMNSEQTAHLQVSKILLVEAGEQTGADVSLSVADMLDEPAEIDAVDEVEDSVASEPYDAVEDLEPLEDSQALEAIEDSQELEAIEDSQELEAIEDLEPLEDSEEFEAIEDLEPLEDSEELEAIEDLEPLEDSQELEAIEDLEPLEDSQELEAIEDLEPVEIDDSADPAAQDLEDSGEFAGVEAEDSEELAAMDFSEEEDSQELEAVEDVSPELEALEDSEELAAMDFSEDDSEDDSEEFGPMDFSEEELEAVEEDLLEPVEDDAEDHSAELAALQQLIAQDDADFAEISAIEEAPEEMAVLTNDFAEIADTVIAPDERFMEDAVTSIDDGYDEEPAATFVDEAVEADDVPTGAYERSELSADDDEPDFDDLSESDSRPIFLDDPELQAAMNVDDAADADEQPTAVYDRASLAAEAEVEPAAEVAAVAAVAAAAAVASESVSDFEEQLAQIEAEVRRLSDEIAQVDKDLEHTRELAGDEFGEVVEADLERSGQRLKIARSASSRCTRRLQGLSDDTRGRGRLSSVREMISDARVTLDVARELVRDAERKRSRAAEESRRSAQLEQRWLGLLAQSDASLREADRLVQERLSVIPEDAPDDVVILADEAKLTYEEVRALCEDMRGRQARFDALDDPSERVEMLHDGEDHIEDIRHVTTALTEQAEEAWLAWETIRLEREEVERERREEAAGRAAEAMERAEVAMASGESVFQGLQKPPEAAPESADAAFDSCVAAMEALEEAAADVGKGLDTNASLEALLIRTEAMVAGAGRAAGAARDLEVRAADVESVVAQWADGLRGEVQGALDASLASIPATAEATSSALKFHKEVPSWDDEELDGGLSQHAAAERALIRLERAGQSLRGWMDDSVRRHPDLDFVAMSKAYAEEIGDLVEARSNALGDLSDGLQILTEARREEIVAEAHAGVEELRGLVEEGVPWRAAAQEAPASWYLRAVRQMGTEINGHLDALDQALKRVEEVPELAVEADSFDAFVDITGRLGAALVQGRRFHADARTLCEAVEAAIDKERELRVEEHGVAVEAVATEARAANDRISMRVTDLKAEVDDYGENDLVDALVDQLVAHDDKAGELAESCWKRASKASKAKSLDGANDRLLDAATEAANVLRIEVQVRRLAEEIRDAVAVAAQDQLADARAEAAQAAQDAEAYDERIGGLLTSGRALIATWHDGGVSEALDLVESKALIARAYISTCRTAAERTQTTASILAAVEQAAAAKEAASGLPVHMEAVEEAYAALQAQVGSSFDALRDATLANAEQVSDSCESERDAVAQRVYEAEVAAAGYSVPAITELIGEIQHRMGIANESVSAVGFAVLEIQEADSAEGVRAEGASAVEKEKTAREDLSAVDGALASLADLLAEHRDEQLAAMREEAEMLLSETAEGSAKVLGGRGDAEANSREFSHAVQDQLAPVLEISERVTVSEEKARAAAETIRKATDVTEARRALDELSTLRSDVLFGADDLLGRLTDLGDAVEDERALQAGIRERLEGTDRWMQDARLAFDEAELTVEAARNEMNFQATEEVSASWREIESLVAQAAQAYREATESMEQVRAARGLDTADSHLAVARERRDATVEHAKRVLELLPSVISVHVDNTHATREVVEGRMQARVASMRARRATQELRVAYLRARTAFGAVPEASLRSEWESIVHEYDVVLEGAAEVSKAATSIQDEEDPTTVREVSEHAVDEFLKVRKTADGLIRSAVRLQQESHRVHRERVEQTAERRRSRQQRAVEVLRQIKVARPDVQAWRRAIDLWIRGWHEDEVVESHAAAASICDTTLAALDDASMNARRSIRTGVEEAALERLERAEVLVESALGEVETCAERVRDLGRAIASAHELRLNVRERLEERQRQAEGATARLRELLGPRSATRRIPLFEKGLAVARIRGDDNTLRGWLMDTADLYVEVERLDEAREHYLEALEIAESHKEHGHEGRLHHRLARLSLNKGDPGTARHHIDEGLRIARETGDSDLEDGLYEDMGEAALALGDVDGARISWECALDIARRAGEKRIQAVYHGRLAHLDVLRGEPERAVVHAVGALEGYRAVGDRAGEVAELTRLADLRRRLGHLGEAHDLARRAVDLSDQFEEPFVGVGARCALAAVLLARALPDHAVTILEDALISARGLGDARAEGTVVSLLASALRARSLGIVRSSTAFAHAASKENRRRWRRGARPTVERDERKDVEGLVEAAQLFADAAARARVDGDDLLFASRRYDEGLCWAVAGATEEAREALTEATAYAPSESHPMHIRAEEWLSRLAG